MDSFPCYLYLNEGAKTMTVTDFILQTKYFGIDNYEEAEDRAAWEIADLLTDEEFEKCLESCQTVRL